jgi:hypothetical protein
MPGFLSSSSSSPGDPPPGDPPPEDGGAAADIPLDPAPRRFLGGSCPWASPSPPGAGAEFHASVLASTCCDARCSCNARCNARSLADCSSSSSSTWSSGLSAGSAFVSWRPLVEIEVPGPRSSSSSVGPGDPGPGFPSDSRRDDCSCCLPGMDAANDMGRDYCRARRCAQTLYR